MSRASIILLAAALAVTAILVTKFRRAPTCTAAAHPSGSLTGQKAPDFALESLDGRIVRLSDFRGKAVLVHFWSTYWLPCRVEMQWFEQMHNQYGPKDLQVLGIAMDGADRKDIAEFASNLGVDYPILLGHESVVNSYGVRVPPVIVYVGRDGKIVDEVFEAKGHDEIEASVRKALSRRR
jgi:cytochrome c biogenesis protein CcmG, thiol:disulfide interchange protein DsbE